MRWERPTPQERPLSSKKQLADVDNKDVSNEAAKASGHHSHSNNSSSISNSSNSEGLHSPCPSQERVSTRGCPSRQTSRRVSSSVPSSRGTVGTSCLPAGCSCYESCSQCSLRRDKRYYQRCLDNTHPFQAPSLPLMLLLLRRHVTVNVGYGTMVCGRAFSPYCRTLSSMSASER